MFGSSFILAALAVFACTNRSIPTDEFSATPETLSYAPGEAIGVVKTWLSTRTWVGDADCLYFHDVIGGDFTEQPVDTGVWEVVHVASLAAGDGPLDGLTWVWRVFEHTGSVNLIEGPEPQPGVDLERCG